ncbi:competence protein ComEA [Halanaerobium saccharolyticum]|uniref:Competence protein ComEA n=1 Tax=Halanaerobium saccharolyticum TaxID=43595 RepID=A0A4R6LL18_9FIRM|nr:helix-hairpin-helix domain-containing protein [Halanaerobium saccharolyticum]TDO85456.1 competence protein ComEA [Halanaerobium saccharolyticum]
MFKNKRVIFILVVGLLLLCFRYYNQNIQQSTTLNPEANLNLLEAGSVAEKNVEKENNVQIVVHLAGAVKNAGVYKLNKNDRLVDLIRAAGGLMENADLKQINLAERLYDGQKLNIPEISKNNQQEINQIQGDFKFSDSQNKDNFLLNKYSTSSDSDLININQADQSQLEKLSGIGPSKAAAIIKYREQNSYFSRKEDLLKVSGIGEKTLENIKDEIVLQ